MRGVVSVARGGVVTTGPGAQTCVAAGLRVSWTGFAYVRGHPAGASSIARFAEAAAQRGIEAIAEQLRGNYFAVAEDRARSTAAAFVDASGYHHAFCSAAGADDDFLALCRRSGVTAEELDPEAVAELITQGQVAFGRTPFPAIRRIEPDEIVVAGADGPLRHVGKVLTPLEQPPERGLAGQLEQLGATLEGRRVSLDLTGGLDSRLLAVVLAQLGVQFETATAGGAASRDVQLARRLAELLGREHHAVPHRPEALPEELDHLLLGTGCLVSPLVSHRELQLQRWRRGRGVDVVLNGLGGEGFKDFFWQQDFPRYWGPVHRRDLERLWRMRIARPQGARAPLAGPYAQAAEELPARYVERLAGHRRALKTQTYDAIFLEVRSRDVNGRGLTLRNRVVPTHAPLLDRDAVRLAFSLPRRARLFNGYHRRTITRFAPAAARLPTTDAGMSASSAPAMLPLDAVRWTGSRAWRLALRYLPARMRPTAAESPLPPLLAVVRDLPVLEASVWRLRDEGVLAADATAAALADAHVGGVLALARLLDEIAA